MQGLYSQWDFNIIVYGVHHHHEICSWPAVLGGVPTLSHLDIPCMFSCSLYEWSIHPSFFWDYLPINPGLVLVVVGKGIVEYCRQLVLIPASSSGGYGFQTLSRV